MQKRVQMALPVLLVVLAGVVAWQVLRLQEPVYQGKGLSFWLESGYEAASWGRQGECQLAEQAIRHMGTNALPILIKRLRAHETPLKRLLMTWANKQKRVRLHFKSADQRRYEAVRGYEALGPLASAQVMGLCDILANNPSPNIRYSAANALGFIGPAAKLAAPILLRATRDKDDFVRASALWALGRILPDAQLTVPAVVALLDDPFDDVKQNAAIALGNYGVAARAAVPALLRTLASNGASGIALKQIDPEAAARAGVK
jgi:HEAT repeat protein